MNTSTSAPPNIDNACQTCHTWPEEELRQRVHAIQDRTYEVRNIAIDAVLDLSRAIAQRAAEDSSAATLAVARNYHRKAQLLTDIVKAENSMGFHADQEAVRLLARAINYARLGLATVDGRSLSETAAHAAPAQTVTPPGGGGN